MPDAGPRAGARSRPRFSPRRRSFLNAALAACLGVFAVASPALAGSYLNRAGLLVDHARRDTSYLRARLSDRELCKVVEKLALARVAAASAMQVPKEVQQAHPHLLLVLEAHAQAAEAARQGDSQRFLVFAQRAWDEERTLHAVLKRLGWALPDR